MIWEIRGDYPDRFSAFAVLPLYDTGDALKEMEYALDTLHLAGVALLTNINGIYLGDPKYNDLFAELNRRNIVVHIHPHDPPFGTIPNLKFPNAIIEAPFDTTRAITNMIHTGGHGQVQEYQIHPVPRRRRDSIFSVEDCAFGVSADK